MGKIVNCSQCQNLRSNISDQGNKTSRWYCESSRTECQPYREIARAKGSQLPIKTAPKWCPLKCSKQ